MNVPDTALVVFLRRPAPGSGKQRLARTLGDAAALRLAQALLDCTLEDARAWPHALVLAPAEPADVAWARGLLERPLHIEPQPRGNLGDRLSGVDRALRRHGFTRLLYIGTDAPSLSLHEIELACRALGATDVVLVPALDGGVALMGARCPWPPLADLPWSEPSLGASLAARCAELGLTVGRLAPAYDIDEREDLAHARAALSGDLRPARRRLLALIDALAAGASA